MGLGTDIRKKTDMYKVMAMSEEIFGHNRLRYYTNIQCNLLLEITQCYKCLLCISFYTNHGRIGDLDTVDH